jgi:hypothetical protein
VWVVEGAGGPLCVQARSLGVGSPPLHLPFALALKSARPSLCHFDPIYRLWLAEFGGGDVH